MKIETQSTDWQRMAGTNLAATSASLIIPTLTEPVKSATRAIIDVANSGVAQNIAKFQFYGEGSANGTVVATIYGWNKVKGDGAALDVWVPAPLIGITCTLGTAAGVALGIVNASQLFVDTMALVANYGNANVDNILLANANNQVATGRFDFIGFQKLELDVASLSSVTNLNGLITLL